MNKKNFFHIVILIGAISIVNKNLSMDFATKYVAESIQAYKTAGMRLSESESAKIFFGVALSSLMVDYVQNLALSKINPKLYDIKNKDTWDVKLYKPFKESLSATYLTNISLGIGALVCGYLFNDSPLKFSDMVKPGALLLTGITTASITASISHYNELYGTTFTSHSNDITKLMKTTSRTGLLLATALLPFALKYCR